MSFGPSLAMVAIILTFTIPIVAVIGHYCYEGLKAWLEIGLKRDMVARGYTAPEIMEVLHSGKNTSSKPWLPNVPPAKPAKQAAYSP